ncbi:hypothetical protein GWI33_020682 [Rhynchophorus ferrugineus]|uniref:TIL domain-containing protein n=1 Tax=Rhynchophorus ferrugineus TaxID=354439 RepID=A0A834HTZ5_RHYFE|nr:hypothetical protein GWI33_020682 [Rhynchophorus ferrugineus]
MTYTHSFNKNPFVVITCDNMKFFVICFFSLILATTLVSSRSTCGPNEEYSNCGSACQETCSSKPQLCILVCKQGCFCKSGFVRHDHTGQCVSRSQC